MKQCVWRVPCDGLDLTKCRTEEKYLLDRCQKIQCRYEFRTDRSTALDGDECIERGIISSCDPWVVGDRVFLTASDKATGDINYTKQIIRVNASPMLFQTTLDLYEVRFEG